MSDAPARSMREERWTLTAAVVLVFVVVAGIGIFHHEMWRDELEIWLIARDSGSLPELLHNMGTEGHPVLWYLATWLVARVTSNPLGMQLLSLLLGAASVGIVFRFAPFSRLQRVLFCFSYFALYEYTVISRNYGLEMLLLWVCCALFPLRRRHPVVLGLALLLLAQTHLFGTVLAGGLLLLAAIEAVVAGEARRELRRPAVLGGLGLAVAGTLGAALHVAIQASRFGATHLVVYRPGYDLPWAASCLATVARGFVPLPAPGDPGVWNSNLLDLLPYPWSQLIGGLAGAVLLALCLMALRRRPSVLAPFLLVLGAMIGVFAVAWYGYTRHHGQLFMAAFAFAWLARGLSREGGLPSPGGGSLARWLDTTGLTAVLGIQVFAAGVLLVTDVARPFSNAHAAARYIATEVPEGTPRVGSRDYAVQPLTAWIDGKIFYPESGTFRTFLHWGPERRLTSPEEALRAAERLLDEEGRPVLLILTLGPGQLEPGQERTLPSGTRIRHLARFVGAMVGSENYWLYLVH